MFVLHKDEQKMSLKSLEKEVILSRSLENHSQISLQTLYDVFRCLQFVQTSANFILCS